MRSILGDLMMHGKLDCQVLSVCLSSIHGPSFYPQAFLAGGHDLVVIPGNAMSLTMLCACRAAVFDGGPAYTHHCANVFHQRVNPPRPPSRAVLSAL